MNEVSIGACRIGPGNRCCVVAELSANHGGSYERAERLVRLAAECGADAVKLQTYTADTLTIDCDAAPFRIESGLWQGQTLHELYRSAFMPWEWQPRLQAVAEQAGIILFSSPFDPSSADFLESMDMPAYKIASFENGDIPLIRHVARKGRPIIMSTGTATEEEVARAVDVIRGEGNEQIVLLKCTSAYPAAADQMHVRAIPWLASRFGLPVGLSDHSLDPIVVETAVAAGACMVEKHFTERRGDGGPDAAFSLEPDELRALVERVRTVERILGTAALGISDQDRAGRRFRRSLFAVADIAAGEPLTNENVRSIRPGDGLEPRYLDEILGKKAARAIGRGTPLTWEMVGGIVD